ncbi:MAG TPA: ATP-binding protein [Blastocatellia bacterium]|nr:ATP-binding protein [Blastocatellia bacterium]
MPPNTGISIIVPAYWISGGIAFYAAIHSTAASVTRGGNPMYRAFSLVCLTAAGYLCAAAGYYSSGTVAEAANWMRWLEAFVIAVLPTFYWFIALYTGQKQVRYKLLTIALICGVFSIINFRSPYSLRFKSVNGMKPLTMPWGETLSRLSGDPGAPQILGNIAFAGILIWALWRTVILYRTGSRRSAIFLGTNCLIVSLAAVEGYLIDHDIIVSFYMTGFAFLGLVLLMNTSIALDDRDRAIAQMEDLVRREKAEEDLRRQKEILQKIFDHSPLMISFFGQDGRLILANKQWERTFQWTVEEVQSGDIDILDQAVPPDPDYRDAVYEARERANGQWMDVKARLRDGSTIDVSWSTLRLSDGSRVSLEQDITERKALEEQFLQAQKMEAIGRLAGGIAHDFNNLLTVIIGFTELVLGQLAPNNPLRRDVLQIENAAVRGASLTNQLLVFSRKHIVQPAVLNLNLVVSNLQELLRRLIGEDIELVVQLDPCLCSVMADRGQMEQVLMNLAANARDAMPSGGALTIETGNVLLDEHSGVDAIGGPAGPYARISVRDTGSGIDREIMGRIFEPFLTTKEVGKGTGLGLSTVYGIVKQCGGNVTVDSQPGRGTTFNVYLPKAEEESKPPGNQRASEPPRGSETILLVEDDPTVRPLIREMLTLHGYNVLEARDASTAILLFGQNRSTIKLVLTDVVMPGMSGRDLIAALKPMMQGVKVLYMSGYPADILTQHGISTVNGEYIQKPLTVASLARKVRELLDRDDG